VTIGAHRKVVTVLFCDVVGSTALGESVDPEALQALLVRYFERMSGILESHGGTVEKFIGDAVMAVFGVPVAHEDDALRACRAAVEMRHALPELGVRGRIGVNTGEVLTGTEERLATGDTVNVAARLEQAAEPGEVLIGAETLALVGSAVEVNERRSLELKGKTEPVAGYPLVAVREAAERSHESRFVGREREVQQLVDAWDRALAGPRCELVTIVGDPGVGKSRLVGEALEKIDARIVRGRCLSYGEGITYWPVIEVVKQLHARPDDAHAAAAINSLLGESGTLVGTDEIGWAFRKLLEAQAPLVVCFDDIQWGEETFLDLVESTALLSTGVSLLLLCMARPELLDRRPGWPATLRLEPLAAEQTESLVGDAVSAEVRERIINAAGGNPLFVTEMLALAGEESDVEVPATLRALLAARLDQLDGHERAVLERGAVEGELFHRGTVQALAPEETEVTLRLAALVKRGLVRPDRPQLAREDAYRFRHLLIRDAAYDALPKATRADLHRRFAEWLEEHGEELVELDEILGYHLEQAARYLAELGRPDPGLAERAGELVAAAGRRALWREDVTAARVLLERALLLTRPLRLDVHLELDLASLAPPREHAQAAEALAERAASENDAAGAALASTMKAYARLFLEKDVVDDLERAAQEALQLLEARGDHAGLARVWQARGFGVANFRGRTDDWAQAVQQALLHSRLAGEQRSHLFGLDNALVLGSVPTDEALRRLDELLPEHPTPGVLSSRAVLLAMLDRLDEAWALAREADERAREQGGGGRPLQLAWVAELAGLDETAAEHYRQACDALEEREDLTILSSYAPRLGRKLCRLGRLDEAEALARRGRDLGDEQDVLTQAFWRQTQALVHSARGEHARAEQLAREAVTFTYRIEMPWYQGDALADRAEVILAAGRRNEAVAQLEQALDRYEQKGIVPLARRTRARLAELQGEVAHA
jgi:class 3 adenylate cyclase/tetratricopeptide (TPR) repeat protein